MKYALNVVLCMLLLWFSTAVVSAQPVLERLEQRIRQRVNPPVIGVAPADRGAAPQPLPPAARPAGAQPAPGFVPGYLGLVADDKKDRGRGVRVLDVKPGGPAEQGGLRKNDLINGVAGIRVRQMSDMGDVMVLFSPGDTLTFDVLRDGKQQQVKVKLGRRPPAQQGPEVVPPPAAVGSAIAPPVPGATVPLLNTPQLNTPQLTAKPATTPETPKAPGGTIAGALARALGRTPANKPAKPTPKTPVIEPPPIKPPAVVKPPVEPVVRPPADDAETIKQLKQHIERLERRVAELEKALKSQQK